MGGLYTRRKYLKIKGDAYELFYNILTFLLKESKNAGLIKEKNRGEKEFRVFDKITSFTFPTGKDFNLIILFNSSFKIF